MTKIIATLTVLLLPLLICAGMFIYATLKTAKRRECEVRLHRCKKSVKVSFVMFSLMYALVLGMGIALMCIDTDAWQYFLYPLTVICLILTVAAIAIIHDNYATVALYEHEFVIEGVFGKDKRYAYADVALFRAANAMEANGRWHGNNVMYNCYDSADKKLCTVVADYDCISAFTAKLTDRDIKLADHARDKDYTAKQKRISYKVMAWCFGLSCLLFIGIFALSYCGTYSEQFQNYSVRGTVQEYKLSGEYDDLTITLKADDNTYAIPNYMLDYLEDGLNDALTDGTKISMLIAYKDGGNLIISQIEIDGKTYLSSTVALTATRNENRRVHGISYVILIPAALSLACSVYAIVMLIKRKPNITE